MNTDYIKKKCVERFENSVTIFQDDRRSKEINRFNPKYYKECFRCTNEEQDYFTFTPRPMFEAFLEDIIVSGKNITKVSVKLFNHFSFKHEILSKPFYFLKAGLVYIKLLLPLGVMLCFHRLVIKVESDKTDFVHVRVSNPYKENPLMQDYEKYYFRKINHLVNVTTNCELNVIYKGRYTTILKHDGYNFTFE